MDRIRIAIFGYSLKDFFPMAYEIIECWEFNGPMHLFIDGHLVGHTFPPTRIELS